ncbi:uncharacterized protein HD556DRAFT_1534945 [Suillus plorans]|uniref:Uncharacterized protein n=1 Tax=Suillus plorans TaxID=116603 RepID=A0A9P7DM40_9AGAM|nr:uncharacterized protein HD556DRAFT_1534945 [Suillus plorans]KAG1798201.1 hypothetical protein HD556DRAFT_1534945 [Suillus plorans]
MLIVVHRFGMLALHESIWPIVATTLGVYVSHHHASQPPSCQSRHSYQLAVAVLVTWRENEIGKHRAEEVVDKPCRRETLAGIRSNPLTGHESTSGLHDLTQIGQTSHFLSIKASSAAAVAVALVGVNIYLAVRFQARFAIYYNTDYVPRLTDAHKLGSTKRGCNCLDLRNIFSEEDTTNCRGNNNRQQDLVKFGSPTAPATVLIQSLGLVVNIAHACIDTRREVGKRIGAQKRRKYSRNYSRYISLAMPEKLCMSITEKPVKHTDREAIKRRGSYHSNWGKLGEYEASDPRFGGLYTPNPLNQGTEALGCFRID